MYYRFLEKMYRRGARKMCLDCVDHINENSRILDLGCGSGIVGNTFGEFFKSQMVGMDIEDRWNFPFPFVISDGQSLPFLDNSFDVVLINYVLHHSSDPFLVLKEAKRVAREKIVIYEDLPEGSLANFFCRIHGLSYKQFFGSFETNSFKTAQQWKSLFKTLELKLIFRKRINTFPVLKELFIVRKLPGAQSSYQPE
ncbi:class I SAM-dependent methyltransferase [Chloroflexota bacterium]